MEKKSDFNDNDISQVTFTSNHHKTSEQTDKKQYTSTTEKGTEFEIKIADLFKQYGYDVTHNVVLKGKKSGVSHQIDVLAEYVCPLHRNKIIIEAKAYSHHVSKDVVMKLENIRDDIGIGMAILATTTEFASGAEKTALQYPLLELWNGDKINELVSKKSSLTIDVPGAEKRFVISKLNPKKVQRRAAKIAKKHSGGVLFGRGRSKERVASIDLICYPYLDVSVQSRTSKLEKVGWRKKEMVTRTVVNHVTIDGKTGSLVDFAGKQGRKKGIISYQYAYLNTTTADEMSVLGQAAGKETFGNDEVILAGLTSGTANAVMLRLSSRGIIKQVREKPSVKYSKLVPIPQTPASIIGIDRIYGNDMLDSNPGNTVIPISIQLGGIESALRRIWPDCRVISTEQVYYPYYHVQYQSDNGDRRNEVIDAITGLNQEYLADVMMR